VLTGTGRRGSDDGRTVVFNWAMLVDEAHTEEFIERVEALDEGRLSGTGLELVLSGPWPPYSFRPREEAGEEEEVVA
jgi:hypothetical protein